MDTVDKSHTSFTKIPMILKLDRDEAEGGNEEAKNGDDGVELAHIQVNCHVDGILDLSVCSRRIDEDV